MKPRIWIDLENAPHVLVLRKIISYYSNRGNRVIVTARDFSSTLTLCDRLLNDYFPVGSGSNSAYSLPKMISVMYRAIQLYMLIGRMRPILAAISHCSRSQILAARALGLKTIIMGDYEYSDQKIDALAHYKLAPDAIEKSEFGLSSKKILPYEGIKEELYLSGYSKPQDPPEDILQGKINILIRPHSDTAHYRSEHADEIFVGALERFTTAENLHILIVPRSESQRSIAKNILSAGCCSFSFPTGHYGPDLISYSDLVLGGGGTMTREAAVLGVPSYSYFGGRWGGVDRMLVEEGRLYKLKTVEDLQSIQIKNRPDSILTPHSHTFESVIRLLNQLIFCTPCTG